jgi:hypothetical protein
MIRIVELLSGSWDEPIHCKFHAILLPKSGPTHCESVYEALSYAWGPKYNTFHIFIAGHRVSVGKNLHTALRFIRKQTTSTALWIDSLSINQDDEEEKKEQVCLMGEIYNRASRITVLSRGFRNSQVLTHKDFLLIHV